jgi:hypothetical protein
MLYLGQILFLTNVNNSIQILVHGLAGGSVEAVENTNVVHRLLPKSVAIK